MEFIAPAAILGHVESIHSTKKRHALQATLQKATRLSQDGWQRRTERELAFSNLVQPTKSQLRRLRGTADYYHVTGPATTLRDMPSFLTDANRACRQRSMGRSTKITRAAAATMEARAGTTPGT
jgi:hypothetical protein